MFNEIPVLFSVVAYPLVPLIAVFVILRRRNRTAPGDRAPGVIYLTQAVGATAAAWSLLLAVLSVPAIFGRQSAIDASADVMPFSPWALPDPQAVDDASPHIMFADFDQVRLAVSHADLGTQVLQVAGSVVSALPMITIGVFVTLLCERIITGAPFATQLVRLSWVGAGVFLVTGFAGQLLSDLAAFRLAELAFDLIGADNGGLELPTPVWPTGLDLWPLWGALALGVLAVLIRHGIRLQRDTEGLV